jgi:hypothetical protein
MKLAKKHSRFLLEPSPVHGLFGVWLEARVTSADIGPYVERAPRVKRRRSVMDFFRAAQARKKWRMPE